MIFWISSRKSVSNVETDWKLHIQSSDNFVRGFFLCFSQESVYGILRENAKDRRLMGIKMKHLIDKLEREKALTKTEWITLLNGRTPDLAEYLFAKARDIRHQHYGRDIYIRGLIEFTNYCRNNCYYCGIRRGNEGLKRYRLTEEEILFCCEQGYALGFRTFVLQGGEDMYFSQEKMTHIICSMRKKYPDCAITLSIGEREREEYEAYFAAGANRFLLRHETANEAHYQSLHPKEMSLQHRKACLWQLKKIGYQVGSGIMVGSPKQTAEQLAEDLLFHSPEGYAISGGKGRYIGINAFPSGTSAADAAKGASALYNGTQHHSSGWAENGGSGRGKCCHAEPFPAGKQKAL